MSCAALPPADVAPANVRTRQRNKRPTPQRPALPPVDVRQLVAVSVPAPWHVLLALGLCPVLCLPASERLLWAEHVALHVAAGPEDSRALALVGAAGVEVAEHPLRSVRQAVVAVLRVERPRFHTPATPWFHGVELHVRDALALHAIPWSVKDAGRAPWEPGDALHQEVRRAFRLARTAHAHLEAERHQEALHEERAGKMESELDAWLLARVGEERAAPPPVVRVPRDPLVEVQRRYHESQRRLLALAEKYKRYPRSETAMCPVTGLKGYLCPECQQWFTWSPGVRPHTCEARP